MSSPHITSVDSVHVTIDTHSSPSIKSSKSPSLSPTSGTVPLLLLASSGSQEHLCEMNSEPRILESSPDNTPEPRAKDRSDSIPILSSRPISPPSHLTRPPDLPQLPGYENVTEVPVSQPAPHQPSETSDITTHPGHESPPAPITLTQARTALLAALKGNSNVDLDACQLGSLRNVQTCDVLRYELESLTETRSVQWQFAPYDSANDTDTAATAPASAADADGAGTDAPADVAVPPKAWDIDIGHEPEDFFRCRRETTIPHSQVRRDCFACSSNGQVVCQKCHGTGTVRCVGCIGKGCSHCRGQKKISCEECEAKGIRNCYLCQGHCAIMCSLKLVVNWIPYTHKQELCSAAVPITMLSDLDMVEVETSRGHKLQPLQHDREDAVAASREIQEQHARLAAKANGRIALESHRLSVCPGLEADLVWNSASYHFVVLGSEHKVFVANYPPKKASSCCCSLL